MSNVRTPSHKLTFDEAVEVWLMLWQGHYKNRIAAHYDVNVWRVYDVKHGKLHPGSRFVAENIWASRYGTLAKAA